MSQPSDIYERAVVDCNTAEFHSHHKGDNASTLVRGAYHFEVLCMTCGKKGTYSQVRREN